MPKKNNLVYRPSTTHHVKYGKTESHLERKTTFLTNAVPGEKCKTLSLSVFVKEFEDKYYIFLGLSMLGTRKHFKSSEFLKSLRPKYTRTKSELSWF